MNDTNYNKNYTLEKHLKSLSETDKDYEQLSNKTCRILYFYGHDTLRYKLIQ